MKEVQPETRRRYSYCLQKAVLASKRLHIHQVHVLVEVVNEPKVPEIELHSKFEKDVTASTRVLVDGYSAPTQSTGTTSRTSYMKPQGRWWSAKGSSGTDTKKYKSVGTVS